MNSQKKIQELLKTNRLFYLQDQYSDDRRLEQATKDLKIISEYIEVYNKENGPRVGDFLKVSDNEYVRFTHHWGNSLQTGSAIDSYYLGLGYVSYSGSLEPSLPIDFFELHPNEGSKEGRIWTFSNARAGGHRGVYLTIPFRVFRIKQDRKTINTITTIINRDQLPVDHPLHVCDSDSPQFKAVLTEYYYRRNSILGYKHPLLKGCEIV